jgi:ribonuclease P protein component
MLPTAHRMRSSLDFTATTRHGAKCTRGSVVAYVLPGPGPEAARVGLIVSKAVGNSVHRHRAARRLRAAVWPILDTLPSGTRVVLRALPGVGEDFDLADHVRDAVSSASRRQGADR